MKQLLLFILLPLQLVAQNTIGLPDVTNYSKQAYGAGLQNWDIKQDKNGILYFANNEGLLSFDGKNWHLYALPNKTIVRSVEIGLDNKIYVGAQDELGYFSPSSNGVLSYHSLTPFIPAKDKSFGDVWEIITYNKSIFFRSNYKIFKFSDTIATTYEASKEWAHISSINGNLYAQDYQLGLMIFKNNAWSPINANNILSYNNPITNIITFNTDTAIITTLRQGLFVLTNNTISKLVTGNSSLLENERIYTATRINDNWIALGTSNNGIFIIDKKGNIVQSFSKTNGLQNNNVLSIFLDKQSNLWLGLDNGISMIAYNSAIKEINPFLQNGSGYTAAIYNNQLYMGTSNGLYTVPLQKLEDISFTQAQFYSINNAKGQTWGLSEINNQLLLGNHDGAFVIKDNSLVPITDNTGYWNFIPLSNVFPSQTIAAGNYKGLSFFNFDNNQFTQALAVPGFTESSRFIATDKYGNIWVSHPYHGVYKISKTLNGTYTYLPYNTQKGLPSTLNNHVYKVKNEVIITTEKGIYTYNQQKDHFEPSAYYKKLLGNKSIRYVKEDIEGNIWFVHEKTLGVIDFAKKEPSIIYLPELSNKLLSGFEFIYPVNQKNIILGGEQGFYHINYEKYKQIVPELKVQVRSVRIFNDRDSLLFGGYFKDVNEPQIQDEASIPKLSYSWKTIRLEYASVLFGYQSNLEYSYRLQGFQDNWSDWSKRTEKEFTNLPTGNYVFEVKVRNNLGKESAIATYSFKMLPPWYRTIWANIFYFLLIIFGCYAMYLWQEKRFLQQQTKHEEEQKQLSYIHELELAKSETELVNLRNKNLEADINFKNSELASSAMHLVKKGELIAKIKAELTHLMKGLDNMQATAEIKKMLKTLSEDDNMDKEWENFSNHFDKVHSDYLVELKERHPTITPNELKLSAYLRMNLSTKEIAQLMNISGRGVEISRYRLRKKLQLASDVTLFDYLISIK